MASENDISTEPVSSQNDDRIKGLPVNKRGQTRFNSTDDIQRVARRLKDSGMAAPQLTTDQIVFIVQKLMANGLNPISYIDCVSLVRGKVICHSRLPWAIGQQSGKIEDYSQSYFNVDGEYLTKENAGDFEYFGVEVKMKHVAFKSEHVSIYTLNDAVRAGLYPAHAVPQKKNTEHVTKQAATNHRDTWRAHTPRMLLARARGNALSDLIPNSSVDAQFSSDDGVADVEGFQPSKTSNG